MMLIPMVLAAALPTIWIVDAANGPGTNFTDIPQAVAAAQSGDTIIVRAGLAYTHFSVTGKALTIRGDGYPVTQVLFGSTTPGMPATTIDSVPPGQTFFVNGLSFSYWDLTGVTPASVALTITGLGSRVVLANLEVGGPNGIGQGGFGVFAGPGVEVHAEHCFFSGGGGGALTASAPAGGTFGGAAVLTQSATLAADLCSFIGGFAHSGPHPVSASGGPALQVQGGSASLSRPFVAGGSGFAIQATSVYGGPGILANGAFVRVTGSPTDLVMGGPGGVVANSGQAIVSATSSTVIVHNPIVVASGSPGGPIFFGPVTIDPTVMPDLSLVGYSPSYSYEFDANMPVTVTLTSVLPSAPFILGIDFQPSFSTAFAPLALGELLLPISPAGLIQGSLDASGVWSATATLAPIPALLNVPLYIQAGVLDAASSQFRLSNGGVMFVRL